MKAKILEDGEQSLDELVRRARNDSVLKQMLEKQKIVVDENYRKDGLKLMSEQELPEPVSAIAMNKSSIPPYKAYFDGVFLRLETPNKERYHSVDTPIKSLCYSQTGAFLAGVGENYLRLIHNSNGDMYGYADLEITAENTQVAWTNNYVLVIQDNELFFIKYGVESNTKNNIEDLKLSYSVTSQRNLAGIATDWNDRLYLLDDDMWLRVYDVVEEELREVKASTLAPLVNQPDIKVIGMAVALGAANSIAVAGSKGDRGFLSVYELTNFENIHHMITDAPLDVCVSATGNIITAGMDKTLRIYTR
jgi:hypothetical protein